MSRKIIVLALASIGTAIAAAPAPATVLPPGGATMSANGAIVHPVVSECYLKKFCAKWVTTPGGHYCRERTEKKVCGPPLNPTKKPQPPRRAPSA
jgi:hypothetical protein